jgi:hypothetical protein
MEQISKNPLKFLKTIFGTFPELPTFQRKKDEDIKPLS